MGMFPESARSLDQEMNALADEKVRYAEQVRRCQRQQERIGTRTVELLVKRLPSAPKSCFLSRDRFLASGGALGEGIDPEYVLPLDPFMANPSDPPIGFALGAQGQHGFVRIEYHEGVLAVSPYVIQPAKLDINIRKLQEYITKV